MINVIVTGIYGRMGSRIAECVSEDKELNLIGAVERADHPEFGDKVSGITVASSLEEVIDKGEVVIDFTLPKPTINNLEVAAKYGKAFVCGTTGLNVDQINTIQQASTQIAVVYSPNMSMGINLLFQIVEDVAGMLSGGYDVEIVEAHHKFKKDAPSGTAKRLAEIIAKRRGLDLNHCFEHGREGFTGERKVEKIGIHALRGGDIIGEHTVTFIGMGERLELSHRAHSRYTFVRGALQATKFVVNSKAGLYNMLDVLKTTL